MEMNSDVLATEVQPEPTIKPGMLDRTGTWVHESTLTKLLVKPDESIEAATPQLLSSSNSVQSCNESTKKRGKGKARAQPLFKKRLIFKTLQGETMHLAKPSALCSVPDCQQTLNNTERLPTQDLLSSKSEPIHQSAQDVDITTDGKQEEALELNLGFITATGMAANETTSAQLTCMPPSTSLQPHARSTKKRKKGKACFKPLFKKRLTFKMLGVTFNSTTVDKTSLPCSVAENQHNANEREGPPKHIMLVLEPESIHDHESKQMPQTACTSSAVIPTLTQLKKQAREKLLRSKQNRGSARQLRSGKNRMRIIKQSPPDDYQEVEEIEMNTGTLYLYRGGNGPRRAMFIRRK